jgi:hypothetical protein
MAKPKTNLQKSMETMKQKPKKVLKKPTGEFPKTNSKLAKIIANVPVNKLSMPEARAAAGKFRDAKKAAGGFKGVGAMDKSGAALGKAIESVKNPKSKPKASKSVTGEKAAEALKKRTSPRGVKKFEKRAGKALDKKYPGLYKKSK